MSLTPRVRGLLGDGVDRVGGVLNRLGHLLLVNELSEEVRWILRVAHVPDRCLAELDALEEGEVAPEAVVKSFRSSLSSDLW